MADASKMIPFIRKWEGGFSDDKDDSGGCTMAGVTIAVYRKYFGADKTCDDLKFITEAEWLHIFKAGYWNPMKADLIENQSIAELCVDMCWGSGTKTAIKKIQAALGLDADGVVGKKTLAALNAPDKAKTFYTLWNMRKSWLERIGFAGNNRKFLKGWLRRLDDIKFKKGSE